MLKLLSDSSAMFKLGGLCFQLTACEEMGL